MASKITAVARLNDEERKLLDERAAELGVSRSELIRFLIHSDVFAIWVDPDGPKPECYPYIDNVTANAISFQIRQAGNNLNQTAQRLNTLQHLAVQGKASGLDWLTYTDLAHKSLDLATESLCRIAADFDALLERAGYDRGYGEQAGR